MKKSAGLMVYRRVFGKLEVLLVHPGGPFFKNKDSGSWTIPKGEFDEKEDPIHAAKREFREETGFSMDGNFIQLDPVRQKSGKVVHAWAVESDLDPGLIRSNNFIMEWPPRSGVQREFPEIDKAAWFEPEEAKVKILISQSPLLDQLVKILSSA